MHKFIKIKKQEMTVIAIKVKEYTLIKKAVAALLGYS